MTGVRGDEVAAVAVGGVVGALARAGISAALPHPSSAEWPWATFLTNLVGCVLLGVLLDWTDHRAPEWKALHPRRARLVRPLLASGVLGGFTTFSSFALEFGLFVERGALGMAALYVGLSLLAGFGALFAGLSLMRVTA